MKRGTYEAVVPARHLGVNVLRIAVPDGESSEAVEARFTVTTPVVEATRLWLNEKLLKELTEVSGGDYLSLPQGDKLAELIPDHVESDVIRSQPEPIWDSPLVLLLLVGLLCMEWGVRKWLNLI